MWTGAPSEEEIKSLRLSSGQEVFKVLSKIKRVNHKEMLGGVTEECLDLIEKCLEFDQNRRPSMEEVLRHKYLEEFYSKS